MAANADLIGSNVTANYYYPDLSSAVDTASATVTDPGFEFTGTFPVGITAFEYIDLTADSINFIFTPDACCFWAPLLSYNGFVFTFDAGVLSNLIGASFAPNSDGYIDSMISWIDDSLFINWKGGNITGVDNVRINLNFGAASRPSAVPEPSTLALLSLGLAGMAARRRKKV
jgi:hypothetical protein